uniref:SAM-dependent methyltransferase n=1 Tax=Kribbia dieselivorans TaxID=331526 RepID=UPI000838AB30
MTPHPAQAAAHVIFVGAGPGDPDLLTLAAVTWLRRADVVVTDDATPSAIVQRHARNGVEIVELGPGEAGAVLTDAVRARRLVEVATDHPGEIVVRLMNGDPATFNGLVGDAQQLARAGVRFDIVPGVSAAHAVPTYAGIPLTGGGANAVHIVAVGDERSDFSRCVDKDVTVVLMGRPAALAAALGHLVEDGRDADTPVALTQHGTTHEQSTTTTTLGEAAAAAKALSAPTLAVVGPTVPMRDELSWFENKPLFGWRVLVPRTKEQSSAITQALAGYGATAEVVPTISVEPPRTPHQMERAVKGLVTGRYEWIGFTSVNAVKAVKEKFDEFGLDARAFAGLKVAAVGGVTAKALQDWGLTPDLVPTGEQSALGLLEDWPEYDELLDPINRVLLPRADIATDTLVAGLKDMGWEVDDVTAY